MHGQRGAAEHQLQQLLNCGRRPTIADSMASSTVNDEMDDASEENLAALERFAKRLIEAESAKLDAIVERL